VATAQNSKCRCSVLALRRRCVCLLYIFVPMTSRSRLSLISGVLVTTITMLTSAGLSKDTLAPPLGWRFPRSGETAQSWRSKSPSRFLSVNGDFTGGGNIDTAMILVRNDGSGFAPFVSLAGSDHGRQFLQAEETNPISYLPDEGMKLLRPGKFLTTCGKGYGCSENEKKSVTISTDAVEFFKYEGPARMIYWNRSTRALSEVWLSD
jgi:hypothetical protein